MVLQLLLEMLKLVAVEPCDLCLLVQLLQLLVHLGEFVGLLVGSVPGVKLCLRQIVTAVNPLVVDTELLRDF